MPQADESLVEWNWKRIHVIYNYLWHQTQKKKIYLSVANNNNNKKAEQQQKQRHKYWRARHNTLYVYIYMHVMKWLIERGVIDIHSYIHKIDKNNTQPLQITDK